MSRCFPYPPPGYTVSRAGNDALIESIKLQKVSEKAKDKEQRKKEKDEKKEKRRERKERKKDKKEKDKEKKDKKLQNLDESGAVFNHGGEKLWADTKAGLLHKHCEAVLLQQAERSSLTEEHGPPLCSNAPSSSSDSTENSNKRKRPCSSTDENRAHGKVIRIRLSKKQNDLNTKVDEQQPCSTSGTSFPSETGITHKREDPCSKSNETSKISHGLAFRSGGEQIPSSSLGQKSGVKIGTSGTQPAMKTARVTPMQRLELQYKNLFANWVEPQKLEPSIDSDDLDWLLQGKNRVTAQVSGTENSMSCSGDQAVWPCARHLPEVDVYALPFTVPF